MISLALMLLAVAIISFAAGVALERCGWDLSGSQRWEWDDLVSAQAKIANAAPCAFVELTPAEFAAVRNTMFIGPVQLREDGHADRTS